MSGLPTEGGLLAEWLEVQESQDGSYDAASSALLEVVYCP